MSTTELLTNALRLPEAERAGLAAELRESLDTKPDLSADEVGDAWSAEIRRRVDDLRSGRVKPIPWDEAMEMIRSDERPAI